MRRMITLFVVLILSGGCGDSGSDSPGVALPTVTGAQQPNPQPTVSSAPPTHASSIEWHNPSRMVTLGDGWTIAACEGEAPIVCVDRDGTTLGTLELTRYPMDSFNFFDPDAEIDENLRALAQDFVSALAKDRAEGCGPNYVVTPLEIDTFSLGSADGIRYGFKGVYSDGTPSELNNQYATIVGGDFIVVTAIAYDAGGCVPSDEQVAFDTPTLTDLLDRIEDVLHVTELPAFES